MNAEKTIKTVKERLKEMARMALDLRESGDVQKLAQEFKYIRIGGESYRAVSLLDSHPLCGVTGNGSKQLSTVKGHFNDGVLFEKDLHKKLAEDVLERKKERSLQCWLIREALSNGGDLMKPLGLGKEHFDKLLFALDEVSLGDKKHSIEDLSDKVKLSPEQIGKPINAVRCDILAVGVIGNKVFPVVIELKSTRSKDRLEKQLSNFVNLLGYFQSDFSSLLESCTGFQVNSFCRKIIIWPALEKKNEATVLALHGNEIDLIEYSQQYSFTKYFR